MDVMAAAVKKFGIKSEVFNYTDFNSVVNAVTHHRALKYKIAPVGFSLGAGDVTLLSHQHIPLDMLIALDPSQLGYNYTLDKANTRHSILWHDSNWLLNGPLGHAGLDLGFDEVHETMDWHLFVDKDPRIQANVEGALRSLL